MPRWPLAAAVTRPIPGVTQTPGEPSRHDRQHGCAIAHHLERELGVRSGPAQIQRCDRFAGGGGLTAKPVAREDHERGADHQDGVGLVQAIERPGHARLRHRLPEEDHGGLHDPAAARTIRHPEAVEVQILQVRVAIRCGAGADLGELGVPGDQLLLELGAVEPVTTVQTVHEFESTVQIEHAATAGTLMQTIDVLGDELGDPTRRLESGKGLVGRAGPGPREMGPTDQTACPVATPSRLACQKITVLDRRSALPSTLGIPVVGYPRAGAATRPGQDEDSRMRREEFTQAVNGTRACAGERIPTHAAHDRLPTLGARAQELASAGRDMTDRHMGSLPRQPEPHRPTDLERIDQPSALQYLHHSKLAQPARGLAHRSHQWSPRPGSDPPSEVARDLAGANTRPWAPSAQELQDERFDITARDRGLSGTDRALSGLRHGTTLFQ